MNNLLLEEDMSIKISEYIQETMSVQNVSTFYQLAKVKKLTSLILSYIERFFPMVVENSSFLELEDNLVAKILSSSQLSVHSEVEVFDAANNWLKHNSRERSRFAKQLLLKVRLPLLSDHAVNYILNGTTPFTEDNECVEILKNSLVTKKSIFQNKQSTFNTIRYCDQNNYGILICGGIKNEYAVVKDVKQIDGSDLSNVKVLPSLMERQGCPKAVCLKGEVYVFSGLDNYCLASSVSKYSHSTNAWSKVADPYDDRKDSFVCAFMDKIFIVGGGYWRNTGRLWRWLTSNSCLEFNPKDNSCKEIAEMNQGRRNSACACFGGRIVVSGGLDDNGDNLKTVESYDVIANKWSPMPSMTEGKSYHSLVVVRNKLFSIGIGYTCEVLSGACEKFVVFKSPSYFDSNKAVSMGNKIFIFQKNTSYVVCYDVDKDEWSGEPFDVTKDLQDFTCVKVPWFYQLQ